jgi:hypothetical protein
LIKLTTEEFVSKSKTLHGELYDYSKVVYVLAKDKVEIVCKLHKSFFQRPNSHLAGQGCPTCVDLRRHLMKVSNTAEFTERAGKAHHGKYTYENVDYIDARTKVVVSCAEHGAFKITPDKHLLGQGCDLCGNLDAALSKTKPLGQFISAAISHHADSYDYSESIYTGGRHMIDIVCRVHGKFRQLAGNHMSGKGCRKCMKSGYNECREGYIYVLKSHDLTKIGITNRSAQHRATRVSKSAGRTFEVLFSRCFSNGATAHTIEAELLREFRGVHLSPVERFDGSTECFYGLDYETVIDRINEIAAQIEGSLEANILTAPQAHNIESTYQNGIV